MMTKVSVIVPVYNTAAYVERCVRSLMEQTLDDIEYIIIDDATPDDAMDVVERVVNEYPSRKHQVRIVRHDRNLGIAATRQQGHDLATGEYVIHCDSDDWVDPDYYRGIYETAKAHDADIVMADYCTEDNAGQTQHATPTFADRDDFFYNSRAIFLALWCHAIRREFLRGHDIRFFPEVTFSEDFGLMFRCMMLTSKYALYDGASRYHYRHTEQSISKNQYSSRCQRDHTRCLSLLCEFVEAQGLDPDDNYSLHLGKRDAKNGWLLQTPPDYRRWRSTFPEASRQVRRDASLSIPYRLAYLLGQHVHPIFLKAYLGLTQKVK